MTTSVESDGADRDTPDEADRGSQGPLRALARVAAAVAAVAGVAGSLFMLGAFGPVSCSTSRSTTGDGVVTTTRECNAGIDYLFGAGGNAPVLFFWAMVLLALVALGGGSAWTGRVALTWAATVVGAIVTIIGVFSIGWYFLLPTLALLTAAIATTVAEYRRTTERQY